MITYACGYLHAKVNNSSESVFDYAFINYLMSCNRYTNLYWKYLI